jgi:3-deoxy-manno-octulosonate cytidylyltransferase (CMP-KDO synthetase)
MIQHTYERASRSAYLTELLVATDDERIAVAVQAFGGQAVMTSSEHTSGTDRLAEVARKYESADLFVNIQGDEPLITPEAIDAAVQPLLDDASLPMTTLAHRVNTLEDLMNPHMGKVVMDQQGLALYFSRSPIPFPSEIPPSPSILEKTVYYNTVGLYGYRRDFLLKFAELSPTPLEQAERLEQLRALEYGYPIKVVETDYSPLGVDIPDDVKKATERISSEDSDG